MAEQLKAASHDAACSTVAGGDIKIAVVVQSWPEAVVVRENQEDSLNTGNKERAI